MTTPSLSTQLVSLFLADEETAVLPDVQALFTYVAANGVSLAGLPQLVKALTALEADAIAGGQAFVKQAAMLISTYITTALTPKPAAPAT
jgi:hypothetical protein